MKKMIAFFLLFTFTFFNSFAQKEVKIGSQVWMTENLNVQKFRNGDVIPEAKTELEWKAYTQAEEAAWRYTNDYMKHCPNGGKLYNWFAINDPRGIAPEGWHVPSDSEWVTLINFLGGASKAGAKMKSKNGWYKGNNGTNSSGFSAIPSAGNWSLDPFAEDALVGVIKNDCNGQDVYWWTSTYIDNSDAFFFQIKYDQGDIFKKKCRKNAGLSVRCVKD